MNKFNLKISVTLGVLIFIIVAALITVGFISFKNESVELNKQVLMAKNAAIEASLVEKFDGYRSILSGVKASKADIVNDKLSSNAIIQLQMLYRTQQNFFEGAYLIDVGGGIYNFKGEKLSFNVKELGRSYYQAMFRDKKTFFVSASFKSAVTDKDIVVMAYKIDNSVAVITSIYLDSLLVDVAQRKDMFLYSEDGTILSAPYPGFRGESIYTKRPLYKGFSSQSPELHYSATVNGQEVRFTAFWTELDINGWMFVTFIRDSVIEEGADTQLLVSAFIGVACLLIALGVLLVTVNNLVP